MLWLTRLLIGPIWAVFCDRSNAGRQATLLWTLAAAIDKGMPVVPLLEALADDAGGRWRWKVRGLAELIAAGVSIPDAIAATSGILSSDATALIQVGTQAGNLVGALRDAAAQARQRIDAPAFKFQGTLIYLFLLLTALTAVTTFIMIWIIPKFKAIFEGFGIALPPLTHRVIVICEELGGTFGILIPTAIFGMWIGLALLLDVLGWGPPWERPLHLASRYWPRLRTPHVLRCLGLAVEAGTPLATTLNAMTAEHPDRELRQKLAPVAEAVDAGDDCWQCLRAAGLLHWTETTLLAAAERAGNLDWALRGLADGIERRLEHRYRVFLEFVHPAIILAAGGAVGTFCLSVFLPIVSLIDKLA